MNKSNIAQGQMFIQFPSPIIEIQQTTKPRIWVKVDETEEEPSLFVDNEARVKVNIGTKKSLGIRDKWLIGDNYYNLCVGDGRFVPIEDLQEVDAICAERGYDAPLMDFGF